MITIFAIDFQTKIHSICLENLCFYIENVRPSFSVAILFERDTFRNALLNNQLCERKTTKCFFFVSREDENMEYAKI